MEDKRDPAVSERDPGRVSDVGSSGPCYLSHQQPLQSPSSAPPLRPINPPPVTKSRRPSVHTAPRRASYRPTLNVMSPSPPSRIGRPAAGLAHAHSFSHRPGGSTSSSASSGRQQRYSTGSPYSSASPAGLPRKGARDSGSTETPPAPPKPLPGLPQPHWNSGERSESSSRYRVASSTAGLYRDHGLSNEDENGATDRGLMEMGNLANNMYENDPEVSWHPLSSNTPSPHFPQLPLPVPSAAYHPTAISSISHSFASLSPPLPSEPPHLSPDLDFPNRSPPLTSPTPRPPGSVAPRSIKSRRSAASLRSIPEQHSEEGDPHFSPPPLPIPPAPPAWIEVRPRPSDDGSMDDSVESSQPARNSASGGGRSTRHSMSSQYATSASTSAWTPSSVGGSRLGFDPTTGTRTSLASRDSRFTNETDLEEYWAKIAACSGPNGTGSPSSAAGAHSRRPTSGAWRNSDALVGDFEPAQRQADNLTPVPPSTVTAPAIKPTLASLIDSEQSVQATVDLPVGDDMVGLGITSDQAVSSTRGSRSPSLSGAAYGARNSRSASFSGAVTSALTAAGIIPSIANGAGPGSTGLSSRSPSLSGNSAGRRTPAQKESPPLASAGANGFGMPGTTQAYSATPASPHAAPPPRLVSIVSKPLGIAVDGAFPATPPPRNPARRQRPTRNANGLVSPAQSKDSGSNRDSGMGFADAEGDMRRQLEDWDEGEESSPIARMGSMSEEKAQPGRAVILAEQGQGRIIDWSKAEQSLETLHVPDDTTHLLLADTRSPFIISALLQSRLVHLASNLVVLDISFSNLTALPSALAVCSSLEELNVSGNALTHRTLPPFLANLCSLRVLAADGCDLSALPHSLAPLTSLRDFSLRDNRLRALPPWLCHLQQLEVLLVDGNDFEQPWKDLVEPLLRSPGAASERKRADTGVSSAASTLSFADSVMDPAMSAPSPVAEGWMTSVGADQLDQRSSTGLSGALFRPETHSGMPRPDSTVSVDTETSFTPSMRKMKSTSDLTTVRVTSGGQKPTLASLVEAEAMNEVSLPPPSLGPAERSPSVDGSSQVDDKRTFGFLKKMSLGKLRHRSRTSSAELSRQRSVNLFEDLRVASAEVVPSLRRKKSGGVASPKVRHSQASHVAPPPALEQSPPQKRLPHRRSFLRLDQIALSSSFASASNEDGAEVLDDQSLGLVLTPQAKAIDARTGLRSIMMYLQDVYDLSGDQHNSAASPSLIRSGQASGYNSNTISRAQSLRAVPNPERSQVLSAYGPSASFLDVEEYNESPDLGLPTSSTIPSKISDNPSRREKVISEIVATERSYIQGLQELQEIYIQSATALVPGIGTQRETVVPTAERKIVFGNVEAIVGFHVDVLLPDIQAAMGPLSARRTTPGWEVERDGLLLTQTAEAIARVFIRHAAFLKLYSTYITQFDGALDRLRDWTAMGPSTPTLSGNGAPVPGGSPVNASRGPVLSSSQKRKLKAYLKRCRAHAKHSQLNLDSYLLLPVQRLPRYKLLLESLSACTPGDVAGGGNATVAEALTLISTITSDMNERKRDSEGRQRLLYWQQRLGNRFRSPLVQPHRTLIREGVLSLVRTVKLNAKDAAHGLAPHLHVHSLNTDRQAASMNVLLCTDLLVLCKDAGDGGTAPVTAPAQLHQALRLPSSPRPSVPLPASVFGAGENMLRYVDQKVILYFQCPSRRAAEEWTTSINSQIPL